MSKFSRCCICTLSFDKLDISSLRCGHTFHFECVNQWIMTSKTCPLCRKKTLLKDIVKLHFDEDEVSFSQASIINSDTIVEGLTTQLSNEKENTKKVTESLIECQNEIKTLKNQLKNEKKKSSNIKLKDERIKTLETLIRNQTEIENEIKIWKDRVKCSEFFLYLTKKSENQLNAENLMDQYLTSSGDISSNNFLILVRGQCKKLEKQIQHLNKELTGLKRENIEKTCQINNYKEQCIKFKRENEKLQYDLSNSSICSVLRPKKSLGFSFNENYSNTSVLLSPVKMTQNKKKKDSFYDEECDLLDSLILSSENNNKEVFKEDKKSLDVPLAHGMFKSNIKNQNTMTSSKRKLSIKKKKLNDSSEFPYKRKITGKVSLSAINKNSKKKSNISSDCAVEIIELD